MTDLYDNPELEQQLETFQAENLFTAVKESLDQVQNKETEALGVIHPNPKITGFFLLDLKASNLKFIWQLNPNFENFNKNLYDKLLSGNPRLILVDTCKVQKSHKSLDKVSSLLLLNLKETPEILENHYLRCFYGNRNYWPDLPTPPKSLPKSLLQRALDLMGRSQNLSKDSKT